MFSMFQLREQHTGATRACAGNWRSIFVKCFKNWDKPRWFINTFSSFQKPFRILKEWKIFMTLYLSFTQFPPCYHLHLWLRGDCARSLLLHHKGDIILVIFNISTRCWRLWSCYGSHSLSLCIIQICFRHWQFEMWPAQPAGCRFLSILQWGKTISIYQQNDQKVSKTPDRFLIDSFNLGF